MNKPTFFGWDAKYISSINGSSLPMDFGSFEEPTDPVTTIRVFTISKPIITGVNNIQQITPLAFAAVYEDGVAIVVTAVYADMYYLALAMKETPYYDLFTTAPVEGWSDFIASVSR
jgi:hypothetical protein